MQHRGHRFSRRGLQDASREKFASLFRTHGPPASGYLWELGVPEQGMPGQGPSAEGLMHRPRQWHRDAPGPGWTPPYSASSSSQRSSLRRGSADPRRSHQSPHKTDGAQGPLARAEPGALRGVHGHSSRPLCKPEVGPALRLFASTGPP